LKKLQNGKIFAANKLRGKHKAAEQRNISHLKVLMFYWTIMIKIINGFMNIAGAIFSSVLIIACFSACSQERSVSPFRDDWNKN